MSDETFIRTLAGRDIEFRMPKAGQILMLKRMAERAQKMLANTDDNTGAGLFGDMLQRAMDVVESLVVRPEDITFLEDQILMGHLEQGDLMEVLGGPKQEEKPKPKTKAKKVTPKASPVASRGRTKR